MALLGVNIDHVATLRNARGGVEPDPITAALVAEAYGADGITAHLREDRRHIRDTDIHALKAKIRTRLNLEMAATDEMVAIACDVRPFMCTLVPERREELTTEGGLDVVGHQAPLTAAVQRLRAQGIEVSLFIDADPAQVTASQATGASHVEFHTGPYCHAAAHGPATAELDALMAAAGLAVEQGLIVNAGHGLNYDNVGPILALPGLWELNIGHSIIARSVFTGLSAAVQEMKRLVSSV